MPAAPKISLVTTNYNYGRFLGASLRSVLDQYYPNLEYIVIDGGSTDESVDIIKSQATRLAHWTSERDNGQSHALNKGLRLCTGDIVGFLNSDDLHFPDTLARVAQAFAHSDTAWIGADCEILNEHGVPTGIGRAVPPDAVSQWVAGTWFPQPSSFWRRDVMLAHGYFEEDLHLCFDQEYWARLAVAGLRPRIVDGLLSRDRQHPSRKTANTGLRYVHERLFIARKFLGRLPPPEAARVRQNIRSLERALLRDPFYHSPAPSVGRFARMLFRHPGLLRDRQTWGLVKRYLRLSA